MVKSLQMRTLRQFLSFYKGRVGRESSFGDRNSGLWEKMWIPLKTPSLPGDWGLLGNKAAASHQGWAARGSSLRQVSW